MIFTNGFAKSGNHALVKAVQLLGQPCSVAHVPFFAFDGPAIFIKRDPRNVLLSWLRFIGKPVTAGMAIAHMRQFDERAPGSLVEVMAPYEAWLDSGALVVSYEALIASDAEMQRIAAYLGVPYLSDAWDYLPGMTRTWNEQHSDWGAVWTTDVQAAWEEIGGPELLLRWGY